MGFIVISCGNTSPEYIVKNGHFKAYQDVTIGKAFGSTFTNPKWKSFKSEHGNQIVEFSGEASLGDEDVTIEIQFQVDKKSFKVIWFGVDGQRQPDEEIVDWIATVYTYYRGKNKTEVKSNNTNTSNRKDNGHLYLVFNDEQKYGYININGELVIDYIYDEAHQFINDYALVNIDGQITYINKDGESITDLPISRGLEFSDGLACVEVGNRWGYINTNGKLAIEAKYKYANSFSDGLALVVVDNFDGKVFINKEGEIVIRLDEDKFYYNETKSFSDGLAYVVYKDYIGFINKEGEIAIALPKSKYSSVHSFSNGLAWVHSINPRDVGYIDKSGKVVIKPQYEIDSKDFKEGFAVVDNGGDSFSYINKNGEVIATIQGKNASNFSEGLAAFMSRDFTWGFINTNGKVVIKPQYTNVINSFTNGLALVQLKEDIIYIDKNGNAVFEF